MLTHERGGIGGEGGALPDGWADDADVEFERYRVSFTVEHSDDRHRYGPHK